MAKDISLRLDIDSRKGTAQIKKTSTSLKKLGTVGAKAADKLSKGFVAAAAKMKLFAIGIAASATAIGYMAKKTLDSADATAKLADSLGYNIKLMQEYSYAAGLSGVAQGTLNSSMLAFTKRVGEAKAGTGALVTYLKKTDKALLKQLTSTTDVNEALEIFMTALGNVKSSSDKAALASAAFSRAGIAMTVMVKDGSAGLKAMQKEANDLGLVLGEDLYRNAERVNDSMSRVSQVIKILFTKAVLALAPEIEKVVDEMIIWVKANQRLIDQKTEEGIDAITGAFRRLVSTLKFLEKHYIIIRDVILALIGIKLLKWMRPVIRGIIKWVGGTILLCKSIKSLSGVMLVLEGSVITWLKKIGLGTAGMIAFSKAAVGATVSVLGWGAALWSVYYIIEKLGQERLARWFGMPIEDAKKFKKELDKALGVEVKMINQAENLATALRKARNESGRLAEALKDPDKYFGKISKEEFEREPDYYKRLEAEAQEMRSFEEEKIRMAEETTTYKLTLMQDYYKKIETEAQEARDFEKELEDEKRRMAEETARYQESDLQRWAKSAKTLQEQISDINMAAAESFSSGFADAFFEFVEGTKSASAAFRAFAASFLKEIAKMIIQQLIFNAIKSVIGSSFAKGGVVESGEQTFAKGGIVQAFAGGGIVNQPTLFPMKKGYGLMGEAGPEAIMPLTRTANGDLGVKSKGNENVVNLNVTNLVDPAMIGQYLYSREGKDAIVNVISNNRRTIRRRLL